MNQEQARNLVRQTLTQSFDKARFQKFVLELLNEFDESKAQSMAVPDAFAKDVRSCTRLVKAESSDRPASDAEKHDQLKRFYKHHFVNSNPEDTRLIPISRTVGKDRVVDEMLFCFTHTREIDWMLPGVAPTGRYVEIPLVAIVSFRADKLYNEHIYWDQASVLVQIGRLDPAALPVAGIETARKLVDKTLPSNTLMAAWANSEGKSV